MAKRMTFDLHEDEALAWQFAVAGDANLAKHVGIFVIRGPGQMMPVGSKYVQTFLANDGEYKRLIRLAPHGFAYGYQPDINARGEVQIAERRLGVLFVIERGYKLEQARSQVAKLLEAQHQDVGGDEEVAAVLDEPLVLMQLAETPLIVDEAQSA